MQTDFNNKRFVPFTDEGPEKNTYGVYDNLKKIKVRIYPTYEMAVEKAGLYNDVIKKPKI